MAGPAVKSGLQGEKRGKGTLQELVTIGGKLLEDYKNTTPKRLLILDVFLVFVFLTGALQFLYCMLVGSFPFNSFLAGVMCTVGMFVLTVSLRMKVVEGINGEKVGREGPGCSEERAFAEYIACNMVLFLAVVNFMG